MGICMHNMYGNSHYYMQPACLVDFPVPIQSVGTIMYANGSNTGYADVTAACGTDYYDATEVQLFCESIQQTTAQQKRSTLFQLFGWHITSMHMC